MTTFHETVAAGLLGRWLTDPLGVSTIVETQQRLRSGFYTSSYVRKIAQTDPRGGGWPLEQVAAFLWVHSGICYSDVPAGTQLTLAGLS